MKLKLNNHPGKSETFKHEIKEYERKEDENIQHCSDIIDLHLKKLAEKSYSYTSTKQQMNH